LDPYFFSFENSGCNVNGGNFYYRVYKNGDTPGAYTQVPFSFQCLCDDPCWRTAHSGCNPSNTDEEWGDQTLNVNIKDLALAANGTVGTYSLDVYWEALVTNCGATTTITKPAQIANFTVSAPLFADFAKFEAQRIGQEVSLGWVTTHERDTENFEVLRSGDMLDWQTIHTIAAQKGLSTPNAYQATDSKPLAGTNYYRLRNNDYDGRSYLSSPIVQVRMTPEGRFMVAPNPANDGRVNFYFSDNASEQILLRLFDAQGVLVRTWNMENIIKDEPYPADVSQLPSGTYFVQIQGYASAIPIQIR
jgi:hypothetical protein